MADELSQPDAGAPLKTSIRTREVEADDHILSRLRKGFRKFKVDFVENDPLKWGQLCAAQRPKMMRTEADVCVVKRPAKTRSSPAQSAPCWPRSPHNWQIMIIGCSDSRVDPALLFDAEPGEFFQVRSVANLVPPFQKDLERHDTSAALEFAVNHLKVEQIIVLGHQKCGGIAALVNKRMGKGMPGEEAKNDFIDSWVSIADAAVESTLLRCKGKPFQVLCEDCEQTSVDVSLRNLLSYPWIETKVRAGVLRLHGFYYTMEPCAMRCWELEVLRTNFHEIS